MVGTHRTFLFAPALEAMLSISAVMGNMNVQAIYRSSLNPDYMLTSLVCLMGEEGVFILNG